jgi:hypothetical protein
MTSGDSRNTSVFLIPKDTITLLVCKIVIIIIIIIIIIIGSLINTPLVSVTNY